MSEFSSDNKPRYHRPKVIGLVVSAILIITLVVLGVVYWQPLVDISTNPDRARELVISAGPWAPVVFILLQIAQVVIAPIPGNITGFAGGYLFDWLPALIYSTIGCAIGFTIVFFLSRKLGRPFIEYFFSKKHIERFDYIAENNGVLVLFLIFLIPIFPDDLICYIAGLTSIPIRTLVLISLLGRFPSTLLISLTGAGLAESNTNLVVVVSVIMVIVMGVAYWQRTRLEKWAKRLTEKK